MERDQLQNFVDERDSRMCHPKPVLMFDAYQRLAGLFGSQSLAALAIGCSAQSIHYACTGKSISCGGFYFRDYDKSFIIDTEDFGKLDIVDYDRACGVSFPLHPVSSKNRIIRKRAKNKKAKC